MLGSHFLFSMETAKLLIGLLMMGSGKYLRTTHFYYFFWPLEWECEIGRYTGFPLFRFDDRSSIPPVLFLFSFNVGELIFFIH